MGSSRLGSILVSEGLLTERDRSTIQISSGSSPYSFAKTILAMGLLDDDELASLLAARTKFPIAPKNLLEQLQFEALECLPHDVLLFMDVLPIRLEQKTLIVAVPDPLDQDITKQLQFFTGFKVKPMIAPLSQIRAGLERLQDSTNSHTSPFESFIENHATNASQRVTLARIGAVANPGAEQPVDQAKKKSEKVVAKNINQSAKSSTAKNSDDEFPLESNELSKDLGEDLVAVEDNDLPDVDPLIEVGAATNDLIRLLSTRMLPLLSNS